MTTALTLPLIPDVSATTSNVIPEVADLNIYFENGKGYLILAGSQYISVNETSARRYLREKGIPVTSKERGGQSPIELALLRIQMHHNIAYAGPLAGKKAGFYVIGESRVLITGSPQLVEPNPAVSWDFIRQIIDGMFVDDLLEQRTFLYGWLKVGYQAVRDETPTPGQALAIAGPRDAGKTLLQSIICACLGGRSANPFAYMFCQTDFNRELFAAECLMFGDEISSTDMRARRNFGSRLKQFTVNDDQRCHAKGRDAITLRPAWRVVMSLNEEPENLLVLPPLDESIGDKITILKVRRPAIFSSPSWSEKRTENWQRIKDQLPGFIAYICSFQIPEELKSGRFGIREFHHPDILVSLGQLSAEVRLLELFDTELFGDTASNARRQDWKGTAIALEKILKSQGSAVQNEALKLLSWQGATGTYLGRLCTRYPKRIKRSTRNGISVYSISAPDVHEESVEGTSKFTTS